jgi:glutathione S-transferase
MVTGVKPVADSERVLWGVGTARALRAHWALHELRLDYRIEAVRTRTGDTETETFTRLNSRQKIPVLCDGGITLSESAAIVTYLAERYGSSDTLYMPDDIEQRARHTEWLSFICMELDATSLYVLRRHQYLPEIYGDSLVVNDAARAYFTRMITSAVPLMNADQAYLLGDYFSGVDILMTTCLQWARNYDLGLPKIFSTYLERMLARPAFSAAQAANTIS